MSSTSGNIIYVDTSNNVNPKLQGNYVSFNVTNDTGSAIADAWVTIGSFTGGFVSLAPNENGIAHLGAMSTSATKPAFFYLQVDCSSFSAGQCNIAAAQGFTVKLYSGPPTTNLLQSQAFSTTVSDTISSSNNSVTTVTVSTSSPTLGSTVNVTVTGATGTIGSTKIFYASPQTNVTFPATSFRLVSTSVTFSGANTGTVTNQLLVPSSTFTSTSSTSYSFVSTYLVVGTTSTSTAVAPVAFISSGAQVKHTDTSSFAQLSPIGAATNSLTLSKLVNTAVWPTGGTPTFTLRVMNSSSTSATLDDFVDTLPSSLATVTYASGTSTFGGSAISNPTISGSTLTWTSTFTIPANGTVDLTFQATVPNIAGSYTNSAVAHLNGNQIDTTTSTSDNSPATVSLSVGSPDLAISKSHTGNFTQGQTGATYSITVSNAGSGPSAGTVSVVDTLPTGLTATALSGIGWSCTLGTLTCTRSDVLNSSASYPVITLTVNVASNAGASLTNTATVSGGGETNTANDSASDVTTITQLPDLTISKSHTGNFTQGQTGATYSITATNSGNTATSGSVTVVDTLPTGLTATAISGTGWSCTLGTLTCTRSDALNASGSYPVITLRVNVANNAASSVTNTATVSGGGETNTANDSASDVTTVTQLPDLTISKSHAGNFTQGQTGATYSITVTNSGSAATSGTVMVVDTLPTGLTATAISGTGWSCTLGTLTCTRSDALNASNSYPAIVLTVNVANNSAASVTNTATVSGGGETNTANDSSSDVTAVTQLPDLTISKTHTGNFTQGESGATYSITITNAGSASTSGTVTVVDTLPTGLTAMAMSGTGWSCTLATLTCTRSDALAASGSYPAITLAVNVAGSAAASITNTATVSGGGETNTANNSSSDVTTVVQLPDLTVSKSHTSDFTQGETGATYSIVVHNVGAGPTTSAVTVVDTLPSGLSATAMSGTGWSCTLATLTCTRSDALAASGSYPAITLTVNVARNAASVTNNVVVSGGGESNTTNDTASDVTTVTASSAAATSTSLAVSPALSVNAGTQITLTATVTASSVPVFTGVVDFCNTTTTQCAGLALLGTAQLKNDGTAVLKLTPGVGTYSLVATFRATTTDQASSSTPQSLAVTGSGNYATAATLSFSGTSASYSLTGTLAAFGKPVPTGTISFVDTSNGNNVLGSPSLDPATLGFASTLPPGASSITGRPMGGVTADLNNDGVLDVVVATGATTKASIFLGNGDGSFLPEATVDSDPAGPAIAVAVGDFNGDGKLDLAILNSPSSGPGSVSILLGNGDGTFQSQVAYGTGSQPSGIVVADFNGDGNADIAVANKSDNSVSFLFGNGDGTFQVPVTLPVDTAPVGLVAADLKNDGIIDIITVNNAGNTISVLIGNGDGTFTTQVPYSVGNSPVALVAEDFNGDGKVDVAVANQSDGTVGILLGNGDGTFQNQTTFAASASPSLLAIGDLDGDGNADLVVSDSASATINIFLGKGDGTFKTPVTASPTGIPNLMVSGDTNGDSLTDIFTANVSASAVLSVLLSQHTESATITGVSFAGTGTHLVEADYSGDSAYAASQSAPVTLSGVGATSTTTSLTASPNPATFGQGVLLTATVSPAPSGSPLGTVSFFDGATLLGSGNVNASGVATFSESSLTVGSHSITATYSGNAGFASSTSSPVTEVISSAPPTATMTALVASPNPVTVGQSLTLAATVSPAPSGSPLGTVSFFDGATLLGTVNVNSSGVASFNTSGLTVGSHSITAVYSGNSGFVESTSSAVTEVVSVANPTTTTTVLGAVPNPAFFGATVQLTATVSPAPSGAPLGTVSFFDGSTLLGTANLNSSGVATLLVNSLGVASHSLTAVYSGNAGFATSTSSPVTQVISAASTGTSLTASPNPAVAGQSVMLTGTVSPAPTGSPFGTISFFDGSTFLGTANVNASGVATLTTSALAVGSHSLTAVYSGNANYAASTSTPVTQIISAPTPTATSTSLAVSPNPATAAQSVTLTASVTPIPTGSPLGTVSFFDGSTLLETVNVNASGVAVLSLSTLSAGTHSLTAVYSGNAGFATSTSSAVPLTVNNAPPSYTVSAPPTPFSVAPGGAVTILVNVAPTGSPFNSVVTMSATGLPPGATASFAPPTVIPGNIGTTTNMTIQTVRQGALFVPGNRGVLYGCLALLVFCFVPFRRTASRPWALARVTVLLFLVVVLETVGCNGGFAGKPAEPQTFLITVTGTSGSLHPSTTVTLIVE